MSDFSEEIRDKSTPSIESMLRQAIATDTGQTLDARLLDNVAASSIRPAGLLNGGAPITASASTGTAAIAADLSALAAAIPNAVDLVFIMNPSDRIRALTFAPGLAGVTILTAPGLTAKTVIAIDAADFVSGETNEPRFDLSSTATIHQDTAPTAIGTPGSPNVIAARSGVAVL